MPSPVRPLHLVPALLALAAGLGAAEPAATGAATAEAVPAVDTTAISAEMLLRRLPGSERLAVRDDRVVWSDGAGGEVRFAAIDPGMGNPLLDTPIGPLAIDRTLIAEGATGVIAALPGLTAAAAAAGLDAAGLTVRQGMLTGIHLRSDQVLVLAEGVLRRAEAPAADLAARRGALEGAATALIAALDESRADQSGREALADLLRLAPGVDADNEIDEVRPSFARRLIRHGHLARLAPAGKALDAVVAATVAAEALEPATLYTGAGLRLAELKDAFGRGGWVLTTPTRCAYAMPHGDPLYYWAAGGRTLQVVDLAPGSDPLHGEVRPVAARLVLAEGGRTLAAWSAAEGFSADAAAWRKAMPAGRSKGIDPDAVAEFMPPHIAVSALSGDPLGLIVPRGLLRSPRDGGAAEVDRFLGDAAALLRGDEASGIPDAAYLDLVGEHLVAYVYDSPDTRFPTLVGNKRNKGDIHQTAAQTVATTAGGMMRGDCDDVAELYQAIAERQGRTALVLQLPSHAACAWAERLRDERWHVYVLQTGPALEFADASLPEALRKAYLNFDGRQAVDPNGLGVLLRFSGENTRGSWRLSWRIFAEPDYCRTMIDVQRDWQYQTYQRGIAKMRRLVEAGDTDTANYRELAGLYTFTGQHALAADFLAKAVERTPGEDSRFLLEIERLGTLFDAGRQAEARALAQELIQRRIPAVRSTLKQGLHEAGLELAGVLARRGSTDLALQALQATVLDEAAKQIAVMCAYLASPRFDEQKWDLSPQWTSLRHLAGTFSAVALRILRETPPAELATSQPLQAMARAVQDWQTAVAFHDLDEPGMAPARYAQVAGWYRAVLGDARFDELLDQAAPPAAGREQVHTRRIGGLAQLPIDLPWIRVSAPYWNGRIAELLDKDAPRPDPARIAALARRGEAAFAAGAALGLVHPSLDADHHFLVLARALATRDEQALRERLRWIKDRDDKRLRDNTAQWLGDSARSMPVEWFTRVMVIWQEELDYKPKWFWIAWRAAITGAPDHALVAARMAADRFPDDPSFAEEYRFMRQLLDGARAPSASASASTTR